MDKQHLARSGASPLQLVPGTVADAASAPSSAAAKASASEPAPAADPKATEPLRQLALERQRNRWLAARLLAAEADLAQAHEALRRTQQSEREACRRAGEDSLTLLHNQAAFRACLQSAMARRNPASGGLALLYLDLDKFKTVNDQHGHEVGDALLRIVAARLLAALRSGDNVGRMGGDEFACLVTDVPDLAALAHLVDKLLLAVAAPMGIGPLHLVVRASLGVAVWPVDGDNGPTLLRHADQAMYSAKRGGGGAVFFDAAACPAGAAPGR